jgi:NAD(P)-dependent dehydrogenase (short-subunit alcohol dehydrogenase family)
MSTAVFSSGKNALITGAASGVGLAVAKLCASHGMNLHLIDNNSALLEKAKESITTKGTLEIHSADVSSQDDWSSIKSKLEKSQIKLDFLHLNAGIGAKGDWTDSSYFHKIFDVNLYGVINGINTFFPHFEGNSSDAKAIVVTGSKQGITNPPGNPAYNASKSAVKTITEHLSFDLAKSSPSTSVHLLVPGWTFTGLTSGGKTAKPDGAWSAEQVADFLYKKMGEGKFYAICPDNDVDWETDRKRMMWTMGDVVYERQPQSRWREEYKEESTKAMAEMKLGDKQGQ